MDPLLGLTSATLFRNNNTGAKHDLSSLHKLSLEGKVHFVLFAVVNFVIVYEMFKSCVQFN